MEKERRLHHLVARGVILLSGPASATLVLTSWFHFDCCKCAQLCSRLKHHFPIEKSVIPTYKSILVILSNSPFILL